ncbi:uncharacterized protein PV07_03162 [Cladophialophora immunda]|uniref:Histidine kinase group protein n=1 Tax=Cladophialophora immunda TaxID=569365 RepID=A0A0D2B1N8_9EURO|nr:uncharacterized protein PV07_03162 [Cladophialophora immunda]KIW31517.1 hypothetical protein PV07_03162 [Cladophialophora immunda]OQV06604.1 hypothetical protein CLAIMM_11149 [Cladophialophora immunda]
MTKKKRKPASSSAQSTNLSTTEGDSALGPAKQETPSPGRIPPPSSLKLVHGGGQRIPDLTVPSALIICRNKHWKHISCYHGPWLSAPTEVLESLAYTNYSSPRPLPVHPAVLFDLAKIRRLVDEATGLAVRAANGTSTSAMQSPLNKSMYYGNDAEMLGLSSPKGIGYTKLSRERKHRMRDQACQKLYQAYSLDEIAASVVMMQSASALEDVAKLVLEREDHNPYAQYVHFFHEKIPCMAMAEHTSLEPLNDVIDQKPTESSPYRTRAVTRMFKDDFEGVVRDCTDGLAVHKLYHSQHQKDPQDLVLPNDTAALGREFQTKGRVADKDQPSSMEPQLLCLRAAANLTLACENLRPALHGLPKRGTHQADDDMNAPAMDRGEKDNRQRVEARKLVRTYAKRALRDYLSYLSHLEYTPGLPFEYVAQFVAKVNCSPPARRSRGERSPDTDSHARAGMSQALVKDESVKDRLDALGNLSLPEPPIYKVNELFAAVPPADVPPYAHERQKEVDPNHPIFSLPDFAEAVSYHPLLIEVLHSLLLCHCILQTSSKELQRHAYMAARVASVADGYPAFLAPRSPARADWLEILFRTDNWIGLAQPWRDLCTPLRYGAYLKKSAPKDVKEAAAAKRLRIKHTPHMQALAEDGLMREESSKAEHKGEEQTKKQHNRINPLGSESERSYDGRHESPSKIPEHWPPEDERPQGSTERADAIVQWIFHAPPLSSTDGAGRSKKKSGAIGKLRKMGSTASSLRETEMTATEQSVESLALVD